MIPEDDIRKVREAADLVALIGERIVLKQKGRDFWGCCPFHNEKTPSFKVDPRTQLFHCFGCGTGGDAVGFIMKTDNLDFPDAIRYLAERANIELHETGDVLDRGRKTRLHEVCEKTAEFYHHQLMRVKTPGSDAARAYLSQRGFGGKIPAEWLIGYAPGRGELVKHLTKEGFTRSEIMEANVATEKENRRLIDRFYERIIFPIRDIQGRAIAFGGRVIASSNADTPKYLNSADTPLFHKRENLYAIDRAKAAITASATAIVVEGYTDVIAMHRTGFVNTVATLGTALTPEHIKLLKRYAKRIICLFDGDQAGINAADRAAELIATELGAAGFESVEFLVAVLPGGSDPAEFCEKEGFEKMRAALDGATPLLRFSLDRRLSAAAFKTPEQRAHALKDALQVLLPVRGTLLATDYINYLSGVFCVDFETVRTALEGMKAPAGGSAGSGLAAGSGSAFNSGTAGFGSAFNSGTAGFGSASPDSGGSGGISPAPLAAQAPFAQDIDPVLFAMQDKTIKLERELLACAVGFSEVRHEFDELFMRETFNDDLLRHIVEIMVANSVWRDESPASLAARLIAVIPEAAAILGAGQTYKNADEALLRARILVLSLQEKQLEREVGILKSRHQQIDRADPASAEKLYREIANKQQALKDLRKRFARLPKVLD